MTQEETNIEIVRRLTHLVNLEAYDELDSLFASDYRDNNPVFDMHNLADLKRVVARAHADSDLHNSLEEVIASGDKVFVRVANQGRHIKTAFGIEPTGKATSMALLEIYRFEDGKIAERWVVADMLGLMTQLGVPLPAGLTGGRLSQGVLASDGSSGMPVPQSSEQCNLSAVAGILDAINDRDYDVLDRLMAIDFVDRLPGLGESVDSRAAYVRALKYCHATLEMTAAGDVSFASNDRVVTRFTLKGKHIRSFMGVAPTGNQLTWTTIGVYRVQDGLIRERWAVDDLVGLLRQMGVDLPR